MITAYQVNYRLEHRRYDPREYEIITIRATTEHSAADKFREHVQRNKLFIHSFFIVEQYEQLLQR